MMNRTALSLSFLVTGVTSLLVSSAFAAPDITVKPITLMPVKAYDRAEFRVSVTGGASPYANPYDPDEVAVDAVLTGPNGRTMRIPAFWYEQYERRTEGNGRIGMTRVNEVKPEWRVRIAAPVPGNWKLTVTAKDKTGTGTSTPVSFKVAPALTANGFIRRATGVGKARYFQYDNGKPYFLIGENVCWSGARGLADYDDWFPALAKSGGNFARLWMAFTPIESKASGIGHYDAGNAAYFDEVLALAQKTNLGCMLAFGTYGEFTSGGFFNEGQWAVNPYNAANGGPVPTDKPDDFFTNQAARKRYRQRLRYLIARYSAFTSLAFWEFWNEKAVPASWYTEMAGYLKANDPHRHLVTNSYGTVGSADVLSLKEMDLTQTHRYGDEGSIRDIAPGLVPDANDHAVYQKPHLMGEFGISWRGSDDKYDTKGTATNLHNGLWGSALSGNAGGSAIWYWDSYIHPMNLYGTFTGLANFAKTVDWPRRNFRTLNIPGPVSDSRAPETFSDMILSSTTGWGIKSSGPVVVGRDGQLSGPGTLISFLYSPSKPNERSVLTLDVDLPKPTTLVLRILMVSSSADLRIGVDGKEAARFQFDAAPNKGQDFESTKQFAEYGGTYQAVFNKDRSVSLPAGKHRLTFDNVEGDWLTIGSFTFKNALSSRYPRLRPYTLQDAVSGETLVWLQDPESNWINDRDGKTPSPWNNVTLAVPAPRSGSYHIQWWDTRVGKIMQETTAATKNGQLSLRVPLFKRDIALRVTPAPRK